MSKINENIVRETLKLRNFPQLEEAGMEFELESLRIVENEIQAKIKIPVQLRGKADLIREALELELIKIPGCGGAVLEMGYKIESGSAAPKTPPGLRQVKNVIAVASGKGGVGKSTVASNLAAALHLDGFSVGVMDTDMYGPSMSKMFGVNEGPGVDENKSLIPVTTNGIKIVSMAMFTDDSSPVIWRGPMVSQMVQNFLNNVIWGELDFLIIDLPPGTGDIQLTLTQMAPLTGAVIVTTPQEVSVIDAKKGLKMFEKVSVPVLGVVENMSYFQCSKCSEKHYLFQEGGGERISRSLGVPFFGGIPIETEVSAAGDAGTPIVWRKPGSQSAQTFMGLAREMVERLNLLMDKSGSFLVNYNYQWDQLPAEA